MALYENKITLKGFLGKDAENFATKQQRTFTVLSLSTKSGYKDKPRSFCEAREPLTNVIDEIGFAERRYGSYHISRQLTL